MSEENDEEKAEKAALLDRIGKFLMPEGGLPPWGSIHKVERLAAIVRLRTTSDIDAELRRQIWNLKHPEDQRERPEELENDEAVAVYDETALSGADAVVAYGLNRFATNMHNYAPSEQGLRVNQALKLGQAQKTGLNTEPKKPTLWQRIRGQGQAQQTGGA